MNDYQISVTGSPADGTVYVHVMRTCSSGEYYYASLLDMEIPGENIIRCVGFSDDEAFFIKEAIKGAENKVMGLSKRDEPLLFSSLMELKMCIGGKDTLSSVPG